MLERGSLEGLAGRGQGEGITGSRRRVFPSGRTYLRSLMDRVPRASQDLQQDPGPAAAVAELAQVSSGFSGSQPRSPALRAHSLEVVETRKLRTHPALAPLIIVALPAGTTH